MKKLIIIVLSFLLGTNLYAQAKSKKYNVYSPTVYKQKNLVQASIDLTVVELVVDYSGSMRPWINLAKSTLQTILPKISNKALVGLRVFGQDSTFGLSSCTSSELMSFPKKNNKGQVLAGLNSARIGSSTPLTYALKKTVNNDFSSFYNKTKKKIILVTDGEDTCGGNPCDFVRKLMAERSDIVIDVIMISGSNKLKCLSDESGGAYYNVGTNSEFIEALNTTLQQIPSHSQDNKIHYQFLPIKDEVLN